MSGEGKMGNIRKAVIVAMLAVVSGSAVAEWVEITRTDSETIYINPATVRKTGDVVKLWVLVDFRKAKSFDESKAYLSEQMQTEYDCKEERRRTLYFIQHSKNLGAGEVVYSGTSLNKDWNPVAPGSLGETAWKFACGKM